MPLETYRKKRNFDVTSEPRGGAKRHRGQRRFVIHEHHASVLHFDLRLEIGGVLKSWSVPKGPSMDPADKRLAVEVEDHPLDYAGFEGDIPEGEYGAGRSLIWDEGTLALDDDDPEAAWERGRLSFRLDGKKLRGGFALVEMKNRKRDGKPQWLLIKRDDEHADPDWALELVEPDPRFNREATKRGVPSKRGAKRKVTAPVAPEERVSSQSFLRRKKLAGDVALEIGGVAVPVTSLHKVYWPDEGFTKGDLIAYYLRLGRVMMPYLEGRPAILKRHPNGVVGEGFFQHDLTSAPAFVETKVLESETGRKLNYAVYTDLAALVYLVNIGTIAQNPWHSRVGDLEHPDYVVFDLDPHGAPFENVLEAALELRTVLGERGLRGYPKTSGSSGIHVFVPVDPVYPFAQVAAFSEAVSSEVARRRPKIATVERRIAERKKRQVYVDWQQNARGKSAAAVYSVRAKTGATVSAPLEWEEVERGVAIDDFTIETMPGRLKEKGDLWKGMLRDRQKLEQ